MKCPYCQQEMEPGYIQCRDGVYWSEKERKLGSDSAIERKDAEAFVK